MYPTLGLLGVIKFGMSAPICNIYLQVGTSAHCIFFVISVCVALVVLDNIRAWKSLQESERNLLLTRVETNPDPSVVDIGLDSI